MSPPLVSTNKSNWSDFDGIDFTFVVNPSSANSGPTARCDSSRMRLEGGTTSRKCLRRRVVDSGPWTTYELKRWRYIHWQSTFMQFLNQQTITSVCPIIPVLTKTKRCTCMNLSSFRFIDSAALHWHTKNTASPNKNTLASKVDVVVFFFDGNESSGSNPHCTIV